MGKKGPDVAVQEYTTPLPVVGGKRWKEEKTCAGGGVQFNRFSPTGLTTQVWGQWFGVGEAGGGGGGNRNPAHRTQLRKGECLGGKLLGWKRRANPQWTGGSRRASEGKSREKSRFGFGQLEGQIKGALENTERNPGCNAFLQQQTNVE